MKIRTIVGILLVFALVLGSTGVATAADEGNQGEGYNNGHGVGDGTGPLDEGPCDGEGPWWEEPEEPQV